jgi:hypothetical protein
MHVVVVVLHLFSRDQSFVVGRHVAPLSVAGACLLGTYGSRSSYIQQHVGAEGLPTNFSLSAFK